MTNKAQTKTRREGKDLVLESTIAGFHEGWAQATEQLAALAARL